MRFAVRLGLASAMGAALIAAPPAVLASAAPPQHAVHAHIVIRNGHLAVAIPVRPGRNAVSGAVALSSSSFSSQGAASSAPQIQVRVGPGNCAGFNGEVLVGWLPYKDSPYIDTWGVAWDNCYGHYNWPSTVYVYVAYNELMEPRQNYSVGSVHDAGSAGASAGINTGPLTTADVFTPSDIVVTACIQSLDGWQCGAGQKV